MSNHNENKKITKSNNVQMKQITNLATWPYSSDSWQEEIQHVCHVLIVLGFISTSGGPRGPCLRLNSVSSPGQATVASNCSGVGQGKGLGSWLCWCRLLSQPTLRREGDARLAGCVFHERNTRGVATNVYLRKTSEKPEKTRSTNFLVERFGSCIYARGRY